MAFKIKIRKYNSQDVAYLLELFYNTVHTLNRADYSEEQVFAWAPSPTEGLGLWNARFTEGNTLVAENKGKIVGFASLENRGSSIGMLYVHHKFQRQGIAKTLLKKLEKRLLKKSIRVARVEASITARAFFQKRGYALVSENRKMLNGQEFVNFIMEKELKEKNKSKEWTSGSSRWRPLFLDKFFDLLIVILGITIAFQLNNWKLESDQLSMQEFYMESMVGDIKKDISMLERNLRNLKRDLSVTTRVRDQLNSATLAPDTLAKALIEILGFDVFEQNNNTYQTLLAAGGLSTFSDRSTRALVTEYYGTYAGIRRYEQVYTELIFRVFAFFAPSVNFADQAVLDASILSRTETENFMLMISSQLNDGIDNYEDALRNSKALLSAVESNLSR